MRPRDQHGFTLVEILVVVLIIGILAAIAVPAFLRQQTKSHDADAKHQTAAAHKAMEMFRLDKGRADATPAELGEVEATLLSANQLQVTDALAGLAIVYAVSVKSRASDGGGRFYIARGTDGSTYRVCTQAAKGGCAAPQPWSGGLGTW